MSEKVKGVKMGGMEGEQSNQTSYSQLVPFIVPFKMTDEDREQRANKVENEMKDIDHHKRGTEGGLDGR